MKNFAFTILIILYFTQFIFPQSNVYVVLGSDTRSGDGLNVGRYYNRFGFELFSDPNQNANKMMRESYRSQMLDSYGNKVKFTWWMMGGNMFMNATNKNAPVVNILPLYLMNKFYSEPIIKWGDEVTFHYHTWKWFDYDGDGVFWWNQVLNFLDTKEDFDITLAQFLLEENTFPVSFRSGWHYMDNEWQNYLDEILPFNMHNDYPAKRTDTTEPLDNTFDWSLASKEFVPYRPSPENYQLPGDGKAWNVRSKYTGSVSIDLLKDVFSKAKNGVDQVVVVWSHLPETDFPEQMKRINDLLHQASASYPEVKFRYCTGVEAMQRWLGTTDTTKPVLQFTQQVTGDEVKLRIQTDEPIFQTNPIVAIKNIYEEYFLVTSMKIGENLWETEQSFIRKNLAKAGAAVTDTSGNHTTAFINFLPDDIYLDNENEFYQEVTGSWGTVVHKDSWNESYRSADVAAGDSVIAAWQLPVSSSAVYNIFSLFPALLNLPAETYFRFYSDNNFIKEIELKMIKGGDWNYISTIELDASKVNRVEMVVHGNSSTPGKAFADVLKITPLVRSKHLYLPVNLVDFGSVSEEDSSLYYLEIKNMGIEELTISEILSSTGEVTPKISLPLIIPAMGRDTIELVFHAGEMGIASDTIVIKSDDPLKPEYKVPFNAKVEPFFRVVDNEHSGYKEWGSWNYSVAQSYGATSRYAALRQSPPASASFTSVLNKAGNYNIQIVVPETVNAAKNALYVLLVNDAAVDSVYVDQNKDSGGWVTIFTKYLSADTKIELKVIDSGETTANVVLRADAAKFALSGSPSDIDEEQIIVTKYELKQNYPNPFNPSTKITYLLPLDEKVTLKIYDILGREVKTLVDEFSNAGKYTITFNAADLTSGIYFYRLRTSSFTDIKKMMLVK